MDSKKITNGMSRYIAAAATAYKAAIRSWREEIGKSASSEDPAFDRDAGKAFENRDIDVDFVPVQTDSEREERQNRGTKTLHTVVTIV